MGAAEGGISPDKIRLFIVIEYAIYLFSPPRLRIPPESLVTSRVNIADFYLFQIKRIDSGRPKHAESQKPSVVAASGFQW